uniref:Bm454 n=1 Tax=Brugia malayi TaxID=6279 RepID=A0A1I9G2E4_BRUMA|nr:Bm454 [Brugia malayi]
MSPHFLHCLLKEVSERIKKYPNVFQIRTEITDNNETKLRVKILL